MAKRYYKKRPIASEISDYASFMADVKRSRRKAAARLSFISPIDLRGTKQPRHWLINVWLGTALVQEAMAAVDKAVESLAKAEAAHTPINLLVEARAALRAVDLEVLIPTQVCPKCENSDRACGYCGGVGCI